MLVSHSIPLGVKFLSYINAFSLKLKKKKQLVKARDLKHSIKLFQPLALLSITNCHTLKMLQDSVNFVVKGKERTEK